MAIEAEPGEARLGETEPGRARPLVEREILGELEQLLGRAAYAELFATLFEQLTQTAAALTAALERRDGPEIERHAHSLVAVSGHMGALALADAARALTTQARALNQAGASGRRSLAELEPAAAAVKSLAERSIAALALLGGAPAS